MLTDLVQIKRLGEQKIRENEQLRVYMKRHGYPERRFRKLAEETVRESERQLRLVTDHAPVLIARCDTQGRYKFVNKPYAARFGLEPQDLIGKRIPDVIGEAAYATFDRYVTSTLDGNSVEFEVEIPYQTGGTQFMRCAYMPERDGENIVGFVAAIVNITDRKQAEKRLAEAEEKFRTLADNIPQLAWIADAGTISDWFPGMSDSWMAGATWEPHRDGDRCRGRGGRGERRWRAAPAPVRARAKIAS